MLNWKLPLFHFFIKKNKGSRVNREPLSFTQNKTVS